MGTTSLVLLGLALIGGIVGGVSQWNQSQRDQEDLSTAATDLTTNYANSLDTVEDEYKYAKQEALDNAEQSDKSEDRNENLTSLMFNSAAEQLQVSQENRNLQNQAAAINAGAQTSAAEASLATSGVRASSSASASVQQNDEIQQKQLAQNIKSQETDEAAQLTNAYAGLMNNMAAIGQARHNANSLRASYEVGGKNYELYQDQLAQMSTQYSQGISQIATKQSRLTEDGAWDMLSAILTGSKTGYTLGSQINDFASNWNASALTTQVAATQNTISFDSDAFGLRQSYDSLFDTQQSSLSYNPFNIAF